jgi:hypothetical protein
MASRIVATPNAAEISIELDLAYIILKLKIWKGKLHLLLSKRRLHPVPSEDEERYFSTEVTITSMSVFSVNVVKIVDPYTRSICVALPK